MVQFLGGPALFFSACLPGGPLGGGPALLFFHLNGGPVWAWSRYFPSVCTVHFKAFYIYQKVGN